MTPEISAKLAERKTVHEWLNELGIPKGECLLRRLSLLCERFRELTKEVEAFEELAFINKKRRDFRYGYITSEMLEDAEAVAGLLKLRKGIREAK